MNRRLAVVAAVLCLGAGAAGCSSSSSDSTPSAGSGGATAKPNAAEQIAGSGCDASAMKIATSAMSPEKDAMNQGLTASDPSVKITNLTSDDSCYLVIQTNAQPSDTQAKTALQPVETGFAETLTSGSAIKGVKITAGDGSVIYQVAAK